MESTNHQDHRTLAPSRAKGYRLHRLEVFNWGTFDRHVFSVRPEGKVTLLVGQNGTGKSTLVDALLTLLVRPGVRNFNVAAGAKKRERDERTYLRGAYDRGGGDDGEVSQPKFLRPKGDQYSVILACFRNEGLGTAFTVAQLLYLANDLSVEKIYCLADDERSIQGDFGGLESTEAVLKTLRSRGLRATKTFNEFEGWFTKLTHVKPKAMQVFNQTVAVKDIQRLNDFIRDHMLEPCDWGEKVDRLISHFTQLSEAHDSLVRVRRQFELLTPVEKHGTEYQRQAITLDKAERLLSATDAYFAQRIVDLFVPAVAQRKVELERLRVRKGGLNDEIGAAQEHIRDLKNQIEHAGGDRLRQIPILIDRERASAAAKRTTSDRFYAALAKIGCAERFEDEAQFGAFQKGLPSRRAEFEATAARLNDDQHECVLARGEIRKSLAVFREELEGLNRRRENIPEWCASLRQAMCDELSLAPRELPFAAELMRVRAEERVWEPSIEKVLRGFALSLLVPDKYYRLVTDHVERTRLAVNGRGQRLVYHRVAEQMPADDRGQLVPHSLIRKLDFRDGHSLLPWVKAELANHFDFQCCDTVEAFQLSRGPAMTRHRHVKSGVQRHEKDDRDQAMDPRNFVLGWDNREKKQRIGDEIQRLSGKESEADRQLAWVENQLTETRDRLAAVAEALKVTAFSEIDFSVHDLEIRRLEKERRAIEEHSDTIKDLKRRLNEAESRAQDLQTLLLALAGDERELGTEISTGEKLIENSSRQLKRGEADGMLAEQRQCFGDLDAILSEPALSCDDVFQRKDDFRASQEARVAQLRKAIDPTRDRLLEAMAKFLQDSPDESADLRPATDYLESFLALRRRIAEDDLPRHELRFKERLNQRVIEEIGLFRNSLEQERRGIESKIDLLNESLKKLEYRPGMHIQLEPRPVRDAEIAEFQAKLRECVDGYFEDSAEANEARFVRIRDLVVRLRDEENRRWRDKVIDVRRWLNFTAAVIDRQTLKPVSVYEDSTGQSGGEKAKLAFTILVAAIAYQYDLDPDRPSSDRFHFVVVDEMFSKVDDQHAEYALDLFQQFGLQLLIVAPLDAKARVTQPYVGCYLHVTKKDNRSAIYEMNAQEFEESLIDTDDSAGLAVSRRR
ncbi:MAG: AAA family ATPase [Planctomycetia bacterium]|nr:AAA family ATPase [Planctomycetia bacterium]